jgi:hypothetical protein
MSSADDPVQFVLDENTYKYLSEEMKSARARIDDEIKTINNFEIVSVSAVFASYYLFLSFKIVDYYAIILISFIPFLICIYGVFRYRAHADVVKIHENYIKFHIERRVFGKKKFSSGLVRYYDRKKRSLLKYARYAFWGFLTVVTLSVFVIAIGWPEKVTRVHNFSTSRVSGA